MKNKLSRILVIAVVLVTLFTLPGCKRELFHSTGLFVANTRPSTIDVVKIVPTGGDLDAAVNEIDAIDGWPVIQYRSIFFFRDAGTYDVRAVAEDAAIFEIIGLVVVEAQHSSFIVKD